MVYAVIQHNVCISHDAILLVMLYLASLYRYKYCDNTILIFLYVSYYDTYHCVMRVITMPNTALTK